jgi:hypothetical protein
MFPFHFSWILTDLTDEVEPKGFVTLSLTNGPEYHVSQVSEVAI